MPQFSGWHAGVVCYIACIDSQGILVVLHCIDSNGIILQLTRERAPPLLPQVAAAPTKSSPATAALIKPRTVCSQPTHTYSSEFTLLFCGAYTYLLFCCPFFIAPWIILPPMSCAVCSTNQNNCWWYLRALPSQTQSHCNSFWAAPCPLFSISTLPSLSPYTSAYINSPQHHQNAHLNYKKKARFYHNDLQKETNIFTLDQ